MGTTLDHAAQAGNEVALTNAVAARAGAAMAPAVSSQLQAKWTKICEVLKKELGSDVFSSWFTKLDIERLDGEILHLSVPTKFLKNWLQKNYAHRTLNCCRVVLPEVREVVFGIRGPNGIMDARASAPVVSPQAGRLAGYDTSLTETPCGRGAPFTGFGQGDDVSSSPLERRLTMENFVVGASNRLGYAAAKQVAEGVRNKTLVYNPLYIHAGVGLGKTHLLQAISWEVKKQNPQARILYLTAEHFLYSFVGALNGADKMRNSLAFKERLRNIDILLMDDLGFLNGQATMREFGHTLNTLIDAGKQVVVAADRAPSNLESLDARIRSRLAGGLVVELGPLDFDLRLRILERYVQIEKQTNPQFSLPDEWLKLVATRLTQSGRELEGAITGFKVRMVAGERLTEQTVEDVIRNLVGGQGPRPVKIDDIQRIVTKHFGVTRQDLLSARRTRSIVRPRQIGMFLSKQLTQRSLPEIGKKFGGRDHTTVIHAIKKVNELMEKDTGLRDDVDLLKRLLCD